MLFRLKQYFVLLTVNVENADSHKYIETNNGSRVTAESDSNGYSVLTLSQDMKAFFQKIQVATWSPKTVQVTLPEI